MLRMRHKNSQATATPKTQSGGLGSRLESTPVGPNARPKPPKIVTTPMTV